MQTSPELATADRIRTDSLPGHGPTQRPTPPKRRDAAAQGTGLCANCVHATDCRYRQTAQQPLLYCEEHEVAGSRGNASAAGATPKKDDRERSLRDAAVLGLCANCDHRDTCTLPRPEGGVWHCEEYR